MKTGMQLIESAAGGEHLLDVPLRRLLAADGQVVEDDVRLGVAQDADDVVGRARRLRDDLRQVLAEAVVEHAAVDAHAHRGHVGELEGVVRRREDGLRYVFADLVGVDVEGGDEVDVADVVAAEVRVHDARDRLLVAGVAVEVDALHQRGGAIPYADDGHVYLAHVALSRIKPARSAPSYAHPSAAPFPTRRQWGKRDGPLHSINRGRRLAR